jgi:outer membrane protein assembly factor BamB
VTPDSVFAPPVGVIPVLIGPLQVLLAILPGLLAALAASLLSLLKPKTMLSLLRLAWKLKWQIAAVALAGYGLVRGVRWLVPDRAAGGATTAAATGADWTAFRGGLARTGAVPDAQGRVIGPAAGGVRWSWKGKGVTFHSSPAVVGNRVYLSSVEGIGPFDRLGTGAIYCFDAESGALVWRFSPPFESGEAPYRATFSSPVVKGGFLVCGEGLHTTPECRIVCLDIRDERAVKRLWSRKTINHVECTPAIGTVKFPDGRVEDCVFVGAGDNGGYHALKLATGEPVWHRDGKDYPDAETALAYHANRLYVGLGNDGKALCVLDAVTGAELARMPMPYPVFCPLAIADGRLYVGMGNGDYVQSATDLGLKPAGELWCVSLEKLEASRGKDLAPEWVFKTGETILNAVAVAGDHVFCVSVDGWVHRVERRTGRLEGRWSARDAVHAAPAVADESVYVFTSSGRLYGLDRRSLEPMWEAEVARSSANFSSPVVAGGRIYVGTETDGAVCAGGPAEKRARVWSGPLAGPEGGGNPGRATAPAAGQFEWNYPASLDGQSPVTNFLAPIAVMGDRFLAPLARAVNAELPAGVACLPMTPRGGSAPAAVWRVATSNAVVRSSAVIEDRAFFVDGRRGDRGRRLHAAAMKDGALQWTAPVELPASGAFTAGEDAVYIEDKPATLTSLAATNGARRWSVALGGEMDHEPAVTPSLVVALTAHPARLLALDRASGAVLLNRALPEAPTSAPMVRKTIVWFATPTGMEARQLTDGERLTGWPHEGGAPSAAFVADEGRIAFVNTAGELALLGRVDGRLRRAPVPGARVATTPMLCGDRVLYLAADGRIMAVAVGAAQAAPDAKPVAPTVWMEDTCALGGGPTSPMVMAGTDLYVGWCGWGLLRLGSAR